MTIIDEPVDASYAREAAIIEAMIIHARKGNEVTLLGSGNSMYPLMRDGRDSACLVSIDNCDDLRRGDIVLYFSGGHFVLHRIHHITDEGFFMLGDGNQMIEQALPADRIFLKAVRIKRGDRMFDLSSPGMIMYGRIWLAIRPIRPILRKVMEILINIKHLFRKG